MKKILTLLCGVLVALSLFVATGNSVKAAEPDENCTCHELLPLTGAERNKIVAEFLSSNTFQMQKQEFLHSGYSWNGAHTIEVVVAPGEELHIPFEGNVTMIAVPVVSAEGVPDMYVFMNGFFVGKLSEQMNQ